MSCGRSLDPSQHEGALQLGLARAAHVELACSEDVLQEAARRALERFRLAGHETQLAGPGAPAGAARILVGTYKEEQLTALCSRVGAEFSRMAQLDASPAEHGAFEVLGRKFTATTAVLVATFEDPDQSGVPLTVVVGNTPLPLRGLLARLRPAWKPGLEVWSEGRRVLTADLQPDGRAIGTSVRDLRSRFQLHPDDYQAFGSQAEGVRGYASSDVPVARLTEYTAALKRARANAAQWSGSANGQALSVLVHSHADGYAVDGAMDQLARITPVVVGMEALLVAGLPHDGGGAAAGSYLLDVLGPPLSEWWLDAACVDAAGTWWGRDLETWCAELADMDLGMTASQLVDPAARASVSPHVLVPLRGMLFRQLRADMEDEELIRGWTGDKLLIVDAALEERFAARIETLRSNAAGRDERRAAHLAEASRGEFRGFALTSPIGDAASGYGSRSAERSLDELIGHGANAVTLTSFLGLRPGPGLGTALPEVPRFGSLEGDAALAATITKAQHEGLRTVLVPHLLASPAASWDGASARGTPEKWNEFFDGYDAFLTHYALLAELLGCDVLAVGSGLAEATSLKRRAGKETTAVHEQMFAARRAGWTRMIERARATFGGALTYAAEWPQQAEAISFWRELDYVGAIVVPDLRAEGRKGPPDDRRVAGVLTKVLTKIATFSDSVERPGLVLELGFRSTQNAARALQGASGSEDALEQGRLYRQLLIARRRHAAGSGLAGLFLWSWSTSADGDPRGFSPRGKPAEASVPSLLAPH